MSTTEVKELVEKGITALKAGDRDEARFWLAEAIQQDARNERAWVYLAAVLPRQQAIAALERVLVLNPGNQKAQKGLNTLLGQSTPARPVKNVPKPSIISRSDRKNGRRQDKISLTATTAGMDPAISDTQTTSPFTPSLVIQLGPAPGAVKNSPAAENVIFDRGYHPLDKDRETGEKEIHSHHDTPEELPPLEGPPLDPAEFSTRVRNILNRPYPVLKKPRRLSQTATLILILLPVALFAALMYFMFLIPAPARNNQTLAALATNQLPAPATNSNNSNLVVTRPPEVTLEPVRPSQNVAPTVAITTASPAPTSVPTPTIPPIIKVNVAQNERAILRGFAVTFSSYENRSNNFSFAGAGTPKNGYHFEGVTIALENIGEKLVPIQVDAFQGVDGRNNFLKPLGGGRVPSMDISRLQMGEQRSGWLTFEVEDGTTLRRVTFSPTSDPDLNNSASVNLTLPPVTPVPVVKPTPRPTATLKPTATPLPTATLAPTVTAMPTPTILVVASPGVYAAPKDVPLTPEPTEIIVSPSPEPTAAPSTTPMPTATPEPTATPLPTRLPAMVGQLNQRMLVDNFAISVTAYVAAPAIKPPPLILPPGYHYETIKVTVENVGSNDVSDFLGSYPFFLRDGDDRIFSVGPQSLAATDRFDPQKFAPTVIGPGKTSVSGLVYFLVRDNATVDRTFVFYANGNLDSPRIEIPLK